MNLAYKISQVEKTIYFLVWIIAVIYSLYCFSTSSFSYFQSYEDHYNDFTPGFHYLSSRRDKADFEWETIYYLLNNFYPWLLIYICISEVIHNLSLVVEVLQFWQIGFSLSYALIQAGYISVLLTLLQPTIFYFICHKSKNTNSVWCCTGTCLFLITYFKSISANEDFMLKYLNVDESQLYIQILSLFWLNLRCTSYYLEQQSREFMDFLSYCLYPPTMYTGPFILYKDFANIHKTRHTTTLQKRLKKLAINISRCLFWFLFGNLSLHYVYVNSTSFQSKLVKSLNSWSLHGYGYAMGQYFQIKYVVLYGLSTSLASYENVNVPHLPRCIGRIHLYSDMWKYFDPGLYTFLLRHIYVPITNIYGYKLLSSFLCFMFVYLWHGPENYILIWTVINYFGITIEYVCNIANKKYLENKDNRDWLSVYWIRRVKCILATPLLVMSAVSNFYFFAGTEIGNIFVSRILTDEPRNNAILLFVLYCCCQVSTTLRCLNANKM